MKLETSRNVTKSKRSLHWCRSISKKYLCTFYYRISQKVVTLSGRRLLQYRAFYYIIGQLLQYRAFLLHYRAVITVSGVYYIIGCTPSVICVITGQSNSSRRWYKTAITNTTTASLQPPNRFQLVRI